LISGCGEEAGNRCQRVEAEEILIGELVNQGSSVMENRMRRNNPEGWMRNQKRAGTETGVYMPASLTNEL